MNREMTARKERILVNLDRSEISVLDSLAAESRRTRSNVISVLLVKAHQDVQLRSTLGVSK